MGFLQDNCKWIEIHDISLVFWWKDSMAISSCGIAWDRVLGSTVAEVRRVSQAGQRTSLVMMDRSEYVNLPSIGFPFTADSRKLPFTVHLQFPVPFMIRFSLKPMHGNFSYFQQYSLLCDFPCKERVISSSPHGRFDQSGFCQVREELYLLLVKWVNASHLWPTLDNGMNLSAEIECNSGLN